MFNAVCDVWNYGLPIFLVEKSSQKFQVSDVDFISPGDYAMFDCPRLDL